MVVCVRPNITHFIYALLLSIDCIDDDDGNNGDRATNWRAELHIADKHELIEPLPDCVNQFSSSPPPDLHECGIFLATACITRSLVDVTNVRHCLKQLKLAQRRGGKKLAT
jgi:hypothetical protein